MRTDKNSQERLDISGGGLDKRGGGSAVGCGHNFVTHVVCEDIVVFGERLDRVEVGIQEIRCPCRRRTVNGAAQWK